jgi:hypothetical protein
MKPDQLREFETYAAALAAERYRVTCIRMTPGGESLAFVLDKQDGVTRGFTPQERRDMIGDDGRIGVTCEFCATLRSYDPAEFDQ